MKRFASYWSNSEGVKIRGNLISHIAVTGGVYFHLNGEKIWIFDENRWEIQSDSLKEQTFEIELEKGMVCTIEYDSEAEITVTGSIASIEEDV